MGKTGKVLCISQHGGQPPTEVINIEKENIDENDIAADVSLTMKEIYGDLGIISNIHSTIAICTQANFSTFY